MKAELREELLSMQAADSRLRERLASTGALFDGYNTDMEALHRRHANRLRELLDLYGWPGRTLAGEDGCAAAWLILQHAIVDPPLMKSALPLLMKSVAYGEAPPKHLAYLTDRVRTLQGEPQLYGTQHDWDDGGQMSPLPMEDVDGVDTRRAVMGMESLASHTARLRQQAMREGAVCPVDLEAYRRKAREWAISTGWKS
jgi:hypothetical protein